MPLRKLSFNNNYKEIKNMINKNIASSLRTQPSFGELLRFNGCSTLKLGSVGQKIRKQLLKEAKNGDLTVETVMPRAYELIGEFLGISNVKTFEDKTLENNTHNIENNKTMYCGNCGNLIADNSKFCSNCGNKLIKDSIKCLNCGEMNEPDSKFCINCGNNLKENNKLSREEFDKNITYIQETTDNIDLGLGEKINEDIKKKTNQVIDDIITENYGTPEEKEKMKLRQKQDKIKREESMKISNKFDLARKLSEGLEYEKAITLFKEVINEANDEDYFFPLIYYDLSECYYKLGDYNNAVRVLEEGLKTIPKDDDIHSFFKKQINLYNSIENNEKLRPLRTTASRLYNKGDYDNAIPIYQECVDLEDKEYYTYIIFAEIYHKKREFELECKVLEKGIENIQFKSQIHNDSKTGLGDKLENIRYYLKTGKFKWDCLPIDDDSIAPKIRKAKAVLKENEQRGVELLEEILEEGTFNNTVYYSLYKTYLKNGEFNSAISIADEAIENLGFYSQDRLEKWIKYKEKAIVKKEK